MILPILKLWLFVSIVLWVILLWRWNWTCKVIGYAKVPIKESDRPWYKMPKEEWVAKDPTFLDALYFSLAWPLLLCALLSSGIVHALMIIFDRS